MATIRVPTPSPGSFNKHAPINHLLATQISHFREVEKRFPRAQQSGVRIGDIATESEAARYIGYVTAVLHGRRPSKPVFAPHRPAVIKLPAPPQAPGLAIAAATEAEASVPSKPRHARKRAKKQAKKITKKRTKKVAKKQTKKETKIRRKKQP